MYLSVFCEYFMTCYKMMIITDSLEFEAFGAGTKLFVVYMIESRQSTDRRSSGSAVALDNRFIV